MKSDGTKNRRPFLGAIILIAAAIAGIAIFASRPDPKAVAAKDYGDDWPFSVASGRVDCLPSGALVFRADGTTYGLTGFARSRGYQPFEPIWLDNPEIPGTKISVTGIINHAQSFCS